MKTTSNGRRPQNIKSGKSWLMNSKGEIRGKFRGNLECGSAQPSLLFIFNIWYYAHNAMHRIKCIEYNVYNMMHRIQCIQCKEYNA